MWFLSSSSLLLTLRLQQRGCRNFITGHPLTNDSQLPAQWRAPEWKKQHRRKGRNDVGMEQTCYFLPPRDTPPLIFRFTYPSTFPSCPPSFCVVLTLTLINNPSLACICIPSDQSSSAPASSPPSKKVLIIAVFTIFIYLCKCRIHS